MLKLARPRKPRLLRTILVYFAIGVLVITLGPTLLEIPARLLIRSDILQDPARDIVLLMGDTSAVRVKDALDLWRDHPTARIVIMREEPEGFVAEGLAPGRDEQHIAYLTSRGVPPSAILHLKSCLTTSTFDESRCLLNYFSESQEKPPVIWVVTSWYHTSRAGWIFDRVFRDSGIQVLVRPAAMNDPKRGPEKWWQREAPLLDVLEEYVKWTYWRLRRLWGAI